ncbi:Homeobox protein KNOX3 [Hordeum vulgare]|nr:Homeobox protein KNOX3 [Hordeum vulgare]
MTVRRRAFVILIASPRFPCRWLHEWEARLLQEANYSTPPDMRVPGAWQLSIDGVPVPSPSSDAERPAEIAWIRASLPEHVREQQSYAPDNHTL